METKTNTQYEAEIAWIRDEVDFVPDSKEVYKQWPHPYRHRALSALKARKQNFVQMVQNEKAKYE